MRCFYDGVHPCGKCPACLANRQRAFMFRLDQERESCSFYFWLTLQYDEEHVPSKDGEYCFDKSHCRKLFEKLRQLYREQSITFKHFLVSEYGPKGTHRPHYHCLLMTYCPEEMTIKQLYNLRQEMREYLLHKAWPYGHVCEKTFHGRVLSYLTKYCCKPELIGDFHKMKPFTLISPGIGLNLLSNLGETRLEQMRQSLDFTIRYNGSLMTLPRYYRDKIIPSSVERLINAESIEEYLRISENRRRLSQAQSEKSLVRLMQINSEHGSYANYRETLKSNRDYAYEEFKSKLKNRKNI